MWGDPASATVGDKELAGEDVIEGHAASLVSSTAYYLHRHQEKG
jgi:hypothetical protein